MEGKKHASQPNTPSLKLTVSLLLKMDGLEDDQTGFRKPFVSPQEASPIRWLQGSLGGNFAVAKKWLQIDLNKKASIGRTKNVYIDWEEPAKFSIDFGRTSVSIQICFHMMKNWEDKAVFLKTASSCFFEVRFDCRWYPPPWGRTQEMLIKCVSTWASSRKSPPKKHGNLKWTIKLTTSCIWVFPKIGVPPNHPFLIRCSIIFTIHFGGNTPIFGNTHIIFPQIPDKNRQFLTCLASPAAASRMKYTAALPAEPTTSKKVTPKE